jgi:putative acetyltransferase
MHIRPERPDDVEKIRCINLEAFGTESEANLVDALRDTGIELISLVAEENNKVIGHILFSPVAIDEENSIKVIGLAPMAVLPDRQRSGVGTHLVNAGLEACKKAGYEAVVVLGHPDYYPRFGFVPSVNYGITSEYDVPPEVFMVKELREGALNQTTGTVKYHHVFDEV